LKLSYYQINSIDYNQILHKDKELFVRGPDMPQTNPRCQATTATLKIEKIVISQKPFDRFCRNSVGLRMMMHVGLPDPVGQKK